ncbi:hypothetical protein [Duncaniella freteri]|uniref:hypothetical protein n=1 Tax=Duncaniella freteri TaxID=2530391 RepID=UPI00258B87A1|nr:hypothetical protein [Duncaniella freteri]
METKATTSSIEVTRNVSTNNEMRLTVGALTVSANVESSAGIVRGISDGSVTGDRTDMHQASFRSYGARGLTVDFHDMATRQERAVVYSAVEDFIEATSARVATDAQTSGNVEK